MLAGWDLVLVTAAGGVLSLDRTALVQTMASRPLVGATAVGYLLGAPALGLLAGLLLELLWLMDLPMGSAVPPDESAAGVLAAAFAVAAPAAWSDEARAALGVLGAIPCGVAGRHLDLAVRRWNGALVVRARAALAEGRDPALGRAQLLGVARFFSAGAAVCGLGAALGSWVVGAAAPLLPPWSVSALELTEAVLPAAGAAAVLAGLGGWRHGALFGVGLGAGVWGLGGGAGWGR